MTEPSAGTLIGQYEIVSLIGHGSTGSVFRAVDTDTGRTVAVKRITTMPTDAQRAAFHREARTLAGLEHPSVLRVVELIDTDEHLALVTEYAGGGSVRDVLRTHGPFDAQQVLALLGPVASALATAHRDGVVHRDVKPSNIVLRTDGTPVLVDFGLALTDPGVSQTSSAALGSASYLDPEVADGAMPSPASDLYSLGVVGYELLTGRTPFPGDTPLAVLRAADRGEFVPLDPAVHGPLAVAVERAIERDPAARYPDADTLLRTWRAAVDGPHSDVEKPQDARASQGLSEPVSQGPSSQAVPQGVPQGVSVAQSVSDTPGLTAATREGVEGVTTEDDGLDRTSAFRIPIRPRALEAAEPVGEMRNWRRIWTGVAAVVVLGAVGATVAAVRSANRTEKTNGVVPFRVRCDSQTIAQCVGAITRTPEGILVRFAEDDRPTLFTVGRRTDALRVSNFFCGSAETLAVYRPTNGVIYYFKQWPLPGEQSDVRADATGMTNAQVVVGDHNSDGCADIGLEIGANRTWFMPHAQGERLQQIDRSAVTAAAALPEPTAEPTAGPTTAAGT